MKRQVRVFSIEKERARRGMGGGGEEALTDQRHREVMEAIADLRVQLCSGGSQEADDAPGIQVSEQFLNEYRAGMQQVAELKRELIGIEEAIEKTKRELATLHNNKLAGDHFHGVTDELDEVVKGTERATDAILESAEVIETDARNLSASLRGDSNRNMAYEIQEQTTKIFEACNFQDLTGQRITKVVNTLRFVEDRVVRMIEIWGGLEAFKEIAVEPMPNPAGNDEMLHGPGDTETDPQRASQDDIDALFD